MDVHVLEEELLNIIDKLNENNEVDGILVQLPLPEHINERKVIDFFLNCIQNFTNNVFRYVTV